MFTPRLVALAALAAGASAGCDVCSDELFARTKGQKCGPFEREASDKWADWSTLAPDVRCLEDVCCALHEDDCCEPAPGPIAGLVIGAVVLAAFVGGTCLRLCGLAGATKDGSRRGVACVGRRNAGPNPSHVGLLAFACCVAYVVALLPLRHWMGFKLVVEMEAPLGRWESRARYDLWHGAVTTKNDYLGNTKDKEAVLADPEDCDDGDELCESVVDANNAAQSSVMVALVLAAVACLAIAGWKFCCVGVDGEPNFAACDKHANAFTVASALLAVSGAVGVAGATNYKYAMKDALLDLADHQKSLKSGPVGMSSEPCRAGCALSIVAGAFGLIVGVLGVVLHVYGIVVEAGPAGAESPVGPITLGGVKIDLDQEDVCSPRRVDLVYAPLAAWYNATGRAALRAKHGPLPATADAFYQWPTRNTVVMAFLDDQGVPPAF